MSDPVIPALREFAQLPLPESGAGAELFLSLVRADGSRLSVLLGTGESVALAGDLIEAARACMIAATGPRRRVEQREPHIGEPQ